jgi:hypothetical protein
MPLTVQVLPEALRSRMVYQMVPAAPSVPWTDPSSAEAAQRPGPGGVVGPGAGCGLVVGTGDGGWVVSGGWGAEDGAVEVEWALQPVTAMAAATATAAMILAGRMVVPPIERDAVWTVGSSVAWAGHGLTAARHRGQCETTSTRSRS